MTTKIFGMFVGLVLALPALGGPLNGQWKGNGFVETISTTTDDVKNSDDVAFTFEHSAAKIAIKDCKFSLEDGSLVQCSPMAADIRNGELWANGKKVGVISPSELSVEMISDGYQITIQITFTRTTAAYEYRSTAPDGRKLIMGANLFR